jgi:hypothetical protein
MKNVRSFLFFLAAAFLLMGFATNAVAGQGDGFNISLADVDTSTFSLNDSLEIWLMHPDTVAYNADDSLIVVSALSDSIPVFKFLIENASTVADTLDIVRFTSANDTTFCFSRIALYREGVATPLMEIALDTFRMNEEIAFNSIGDEIAVGDTAIYYFEVDINSTVVDAGYDSLYAGIKIMGGDIEMANAGSAPDLGNVLIYTILPTRSGGRLLQFDTKPPDLVIEFEHAEDNGGGCTNNNIVNLGDSIVIYAWDSTGVYEIEYAWAYLDIFGAGIDTIAGDSVEFDTIYAPASDSAAFFEWKIPDATFIGSDEIASGFYWLVVGAIDASGNSIVDSIQIFKDIDTEQPIFDDVVVGTDTVHVWAELSYDANGDGTAAIGDSISFYSYLTSNPFGEVDSVIIDLTGWGLSMISLDDQSGDRRFSTSIEIGVGTLDLAAGDSATIYYITAYDNACNTATDSALAPVPIDNEIPGPPDAITYVRYADNDFNNIINIGDEVEIEVDASSTTDLATDCGIYVDLYNSGLGGSAIQCIDLSGGLYTLQTMVYDGGVNAVDVGANVHNVTITMTDDAGNTEDYTSPNIVYPIDTDPPPGVTDLEVTLGPCAMNVTWSGDVDDSIYLVFWDGGDGWEVGTDYEIDTVFGVQVYNFLDTLGATSDTTYWITDATTPLDHGSTYEFVVRSIDNANNREYNFDRASNQADCVAPTACITFPVTDGGAYGTSNVLEIVAESPDGDIANARLWIRDADIGSGVPGTWMDAGLMTDNGGGIFSYTIDSNAMHNIAGFDCSDWHYEAIVQASDTVGNVRNVPTILTDCPYGTFEFDWFCAPLPVALISVNGAVDPQTGCGFDVTRDDQNTVEINVANFSAGDTYVVDVNVIIDWQYTRVYYNDTVATMPFTFPLDATLFPKGTQTMWITVTRDDGNTNTISAPLCVPDEDAPMATIVAPTDGQWVRKGCTFMSTINVWAKIDYTASYDFGGTSKVEFYESDDGETWTLFDVVTSMTGSDSTWRASWNNCAYEHGANAYLQAIFFDNAGNTYTTPSIMVSVDGEAPDITLSMTGEQDVCGVATIGGYIDLVATVNTVWEDIDEVYFIYAPADSPDIPSFYRLIGTGEPTGLNHIYTYYDFDTEDLVDGKTYRFRAIARDITGNTMWDYNGDGNMDAYTFDPINKNSDALYMIDNTPVTAAFGHAVVTDDVTPWHEFPTPSAKLGGTDRIYAVQGMDVTLHTWTIPQDDTCCYEKVVYMIGGDEVAVSYGPPPFEVTINPMTMGLVDLEDLNDDGYDNLDLDLTFYDCFGRTNSDEIYLYILNNEANPVVFAEPFNGECVAGEVDLEALAINDYDVREVKYYWRTPGGTWNFIGSSEDYDYDFPVTWYTVNAGIADGTIELGAISVDWAGNESAASVISVTVANDPPVAEITAPADLSYIGNGTLVEANVTSGAAVDMRFLYKSQTSDSWMQFSRDFNSPWVADFDPDPSDGWYNIRVKPYNCADVSSYSETITVWYDDTNPYARLTSVAGQDAGTGDPDIDVTGMSTVTVTGRFADDQFPGGGSGLVMVGFMLMNSDEDAVREIIIDPAAAGVHTAQFDISGLGIGEYVFQGWGMDAVGNIGYTQQVSVYIYDYTAPTVAIAGYYNHTLYGYDWSGDAEAVLFERQEGTAWVGIGIAEETCSGLWAASWGEPQSGTIRVISIDDEGNRDDANALTATFTYTDEDSYGFGTTDLTIMANKNHTNCNMDGIVRITSDLGEPVVIGIYDYGDDCEIISLDENQQTDGMYYGSFDAGELYGENYAVFFVSAPTESGTMEIAYTMIGTYEAYPDYGTNGYVEGPMDEVMVNIQPGAVSSYTTFTIMETWIPEAGIDQDHFSVLGNDDGNGWYVSCRSCTLDAPDKDGGTPPASQNGFDCCFNANKFAIITMPYDSGDDTPAESLAVAWWDPIGNEWDFSGIYYPTFVGGFDTGTNTVEFATDCLYGLYAVISYRTPSHPGPIEIELLADYCGDYYFSQYPTFILRVEDQFSDISFSDVGVKVDNMPIREGGSTADGFYITYDDVTNLLEVYWADWDEYEWEWWSPLACGDHTLKVWAKNNQGNYAEMLYDFTVDCTPPEIVFENTYVGKNPTIQFTITDDESGVSSDDIYVDVIAVQTTDTNVYNPNQYENLFFLQTFFPGQIEIDEEGVVTIPTTFELEDERAIVVIIYDGIKTNSYQYGDPVDYHDWSEYYAPDHGVPDCVGNNQTPIVQILAIDVDAPTIWVVGYDEPGDLIDALPGGCVEIQVMDDGYGFDDNDVMIYEDGLPIDRVAPGEVEEGEYSFNSTTGMINYCPTPGAKIEITVTDNAGNTVSRLFGTGDPTQIAQATVTYNPWDPSEFSTQTISIDFTGDAWLKIYDFGGDLVKALHTTNGMFSWNGMTEDGTRVADGVYIGHITVDTDAGTYSTVVKIAIVEK